MGKRSKSSRKGKKEWRANISTEDIDDFYEKSTKDALSGGSLADVPSDSLFFVDKSRDLSVKRKIEKHREKTLHSDSLLKRNPFVQTIPTNKQRESKKQKKQVKFPKVEDQDSQKDNGGLVDIWDDKGETNVKIKKKPKPSIIPAVEVDPAGCSFNPDFEYHQDSLARAVADEMKKVYRNELGPAPVPLTVPGEAVDEEDMLFLEADAGSDEEDQDEGVAKDGDEDINQRVIKTKRVTRVELNRRARRKERLRAEEEAKQVKKLSSEIDSIPDILAEIEEEDAEKDKKHLRRVVAKQEMLKARPPRMGKYKFEPAPVQVLLSEEINGSLRKLKACATLARDRFKSLEKRGLVIPSKKTGRHFGTGDLGSLFRTSKTRTIMRILATRLASYLSTTRRRYPINTQSRHFCSSSRGKVDEKALEEEAERKIGWFLKLLFAGTATIVAYQFFPYMGENLMQQSVSLLHVKDPLFKRMGASRLARFAVDDYKRMKIVEIGGAKELLNMLETAKDDPTRKEALRALDAISKSDEAALSLLKAGALSVIRSLPDSSDDAEVEKFKLSLLQRYQDISRRDWHDIFVIMEKLAKVSDQEIAIEFFLGRKCRANIAVSSLVSSDPVAFKFLTSSPHKFLVNPPAGLIPPLSTTTVQVILKPQSELPPTYPRSPSDRFLIKTAIASDLNPTHHPEFINSWFNSNPHIPTRDIKLKVAFVGPFLLHHAVGLGDIHAVRSLIKRQKSLVSDLSVQDADSLHEAARKSERINQDNGSMVDLLVEAGLNVARKRTDDGLFHDVSLAAKGWAELHAAVAFDRTDEVERIVRTREYGSLDSRDKEGQTPLHLAASKGHLECAKILVGAGVHVDARSKDGRTALFRAAANGDRPMVELLIKMNADPNIAEKHHGRSAIDVARDKGHDEVVKLLGRGEAVLRAARRGELKLLELLLQRGAFVDFCDQHGLTALHMAAIKGFKDAVLKLVEFGAALECQDAEGHTPLHMAVESGCLETVEVLIIRGANVNAMSKKGATPLYISKMMGHNDISCLLINKGATNSVSSASTALVPL
ncbi:OLC1v1026932C1 [Oldenlandia corymbosa var. corymbosa]|uniref:Ribosome biogenesis protein NOP53 n=1 Tax=Oldenlandia corymbosa var. corymbosa TaxID=529605 RepID=A0AAV1C8H7_OLDCO|nr:OLC1v1026932C1 [Oldenlandia corymbosa var. corymbosa]